MNGEYLPLRREFRPARAIDVREIALDNAAARQAFGWAPATGLDAGLRLAWDWFRAAA